MFKPSISQLKYQQLGYFICAQTVRPRRQQLQVLSQLQGGSRQGGFNGGGMGGQFGQQLGGGQLLGGGGGQESGYGLQPDGVLHSPGKIEENMRKRKTSEDDKETEQQKRTEFRFQLETDERRQARTPPTTNKKELVEFFLETDTRDMDYEVGRCFKYLDEEFYQTLDNVLGTIRFGENPDEDRVQELELLRKYLKVTQQKIDTIIAGSQSIQERLKFLLSSKDKKKAILELAGNNQINQQLIDFIEINAQGAQDAKQDQIYEYLQKVKAECQKYLITPELKDAKKVENVA